MILTDNVFLLKTKFPFVFKLLESCKTEHLIQIVETKSDKPTLSIEIAGISHYLHSKYDPNYEAEKLIEQYQDIEYEHVLFYGVGLGYHIDRFAKKHPTTPFSIYEPDSEIFRLFLSRQKLKQWALLKHIYLETDPLQCRAYTQDFVNKTSGQALIIVLPSYERTFVNNYKMFTECMQIHLQEARKMFQLRHAFEKKWVINSLDNFRFTLKAQNIFEKRSLFKGKPVLIVAAGPSLEEEFDHLRYIKDNKLAYIFAVGSAVSSLLHYGIVPDGACTYDPHFHNVNVYKKVIDEQITDIPLIYGTTVGYGTLAQYPGPLLSLLTDKDEIGNLLLRGKNGNSLDKIEDAPSIAVVALQLFYKMGCNPIVMVGQNLGFRNNSYYASGVQYTDRGHELTTYDLLDAFLVDDVEGNPIYTNWSFNTMRLEMERFIKRYSGVEIINTTQGGAAIQGTKHIALQMVIQQYFSKEVVDPYWYQNRGDGFDLRYLQEKAEYLDDQYGSLLKQIDKIVDIFKQMDRSVKQRNGKKAFKLSQKLDSAFENLQKNEFFKVILKPMNMLQIQWITEQFDAIIYERDILVKTTKIIEKLGKLVYDIRQDISTIDPLYFRMQKAVQESVNDLQEKMNVELGCN